jgi:hypothetical protein
MKSPTVVVMLLAFVFAASAEPIRLAVVATDRTLDPAADVLTVALSKDARVTLLERGDINRILGEQQLSASTGECVSLGRLLHADGVIVLRRAQVQQQQLIVADLVSVGLGFRLNVFAHRHPVEDFDSWSLAIKDRFSPLLPKLGVQPRDAIPVSLLNLRSAVATTDSKVLERSLTFLLAARLVREPKVFVLERQHLSALELDKNFIAPSGVPEWATARFVTDGEIQLGGPDQDRVVLQMKTEPPRDRPATVFTVTGSRQYLADLVDRAVVRLLAAIGQPVAEFEWQPQAEAERFRREAFSAERAGLDDEALAAGEASHALGGRSEELIGLIARQSCRKAFSGRGDLSQGYERSQVDPMGLDIGLVQRAFELANTRTNQSPELEILVTAARMIRYFRETGGYDAHRQELESLRTDLRNTVQRITHREKEMNRLEFCGFLGSYAPYLYDDPRQVIDSYRRVLQQRFVSGSGPSFPHATYAIAMARHYLSEARDTPRLFGIQAERTPWLVGWRRESPEQLNEIWERFLSQLSQSTKVTDRLDGLLFRLYSADDEPARKAVEQQIRESLWTARKALVEDTFTYAIAVQLLYAAGGNDEAFWFKLLHFFFQEARFYDFQILERSVNWINGDRFGFKNPEYRSALLKSMDAYGERMKGNRNFQPAEFAKYRGRLLEGLQEDLKPTRQTLNLTKGWHPDVSAEAWRHQSVFFIRKVMYKDSQAWVLMRRTLGKRTMNLFQVDPTTLSEVSLEIPSSEASGTINSIDMSYDFEVTQQHVFVAAPGRLLRYDRAAHTWSSTQVPSNNFPSLTFLGDALYYAFPGHMGRWGQAQAASGILRIDPQTLEQRVLASSRRKQPATVLDDVPAYKVPSLFLGPGGRLHAVVNFEGVRRRGENLKVLSYNETSHDWTPILTGELEGIKGRFGLLAFHGENGTLFQHLDVTGRGAEFSLMLLRRDGRFEHLIAPVDSRPDSSRRAPWLAPETPWDFSGSPSTPLVASRDGKVYWALLKHLTSTKESLALYRYVPGMLSPATIPIAFARREAAVTNLDPCLFATPAGLLVGNAGGAAFWIIPWPELDAFQSPNKAPNDSK